MKRKKFTRKQKAWADALLNDKTKSLLDATREAYPDAQENTQKLIAQKNKNNPVIQAYMQRHSDIATNAMMETLEVSRVYSKKGGTAGAAYAGVVATISKDIHDRVFGKATQKIDMQSTKVSVNIDLTSDNRDIIEGKSL